MANRTDGGAFPRLERAMKDFAEKSYEELARFRWAEEREWYECALFYQRRQWLSWSKGERRWKPIEQNARQPKPMPVSNYFAMTVNANANRLAANLPRMQATARSDQDEDQRAADMAGKAIPVIDSESGMRIMNPLLAKHAALWGMGITKDVFDASLSTGRTSLPEVAVRRIPTLACRECGHSYDAPAESGPRVNQAPEKPEAQPAAPVGGDGAGGDDGEACPRCGAPGMQTGERSELQVERTMSFTKGKITTEVVPVFEVYLPRDCQNPNLAKVVVQRFRKPLGELKRMFGDAAADLKGETPADVHEVYLEALRSLVTYGQMQDRSIPTATCTEMWFDWDEAPKELRDEIEAYCADDADALENWQELGGYVILAGGEVMDFGPNPLDGKKPYTFFLWEVDPANVYPKGVGVDLVPLQKRLNRLDSLMELGMMCNAAGKWLWPKTQGGCEPPSGSPNEVAEYDPIGEGKIAPTFVQPSPFHQACWQLRQAILADFEQLGMTLPASKGEADGQVESFRGLAYLGAKAEEQINTQRFLYELGHQLRYEKTLSMARKWWDEPRLAKIAGANAKFKVQAFDREDLAGDYEIEFVPGSSRPRTLAEKQQAFAGLLQAGFVDAKDETTRQFVLDLADLPELDLAGTRQYVKAQRMLEAAKGGALPQPNPFVDASIALGVFVDFVLTEEFEQLPPPVQQGILAAAQAWKAQMAQAAQGGMPPAKPLSESLTVNFKDLPPDVQAQIVGRLGFHMSLPPAPPPQGAGPQGRRLPPPPSPLSGVPGAGVPLGAVEQAALAEASRSAGAPAPR